ncbi:hypothetical protein F5X68DRAFT_203549 [Plectosphaerella plurivora]|uniref:Uncharacterized protein n=1 Tax=Plectosphaerella plurivora TaxID=936078 RepID=A0A9P9AE62_9PEZI|nr:hypothetical protein F5X68DRAFT_203549 [Plectosphaerella plurivora]
MEAITSSLTPAEKAKLHEVADGLLNVYRTLARMTHLESSWIKEGPHDMTSLLPECKEMGLDASIIYLYSIVPYVYHPGEWFFFQGGYFMYMDVEGSRDPFFMENDKEMLRPWMTPLSRMGNHSTVLIYDAKRHVIGMFSQENIGDSTDHNYNDDVADDSDDAFDGDVFNYEKMAARPAPDVLRDMARWFEDFTETPGEGGWGSDEEDTILLYRKHGWPGPDFDGDAFCVDQIRAAAAGKAMYHAEEPLRQVEKFQMWLGHAETGRLDKARKAILESDNTDDEWLGRWELWLEVHDRQELELELAEAKETAERLCPGGVCLKPDELPPRELQVLREHALYETRRTESMQKNAEETGNFSEALRYKIKTNAFLQRAIEACEAEVGDRSLPERRGWKELGLDLDDKFERETLSLKGLERGVKAVREWLAEAPEAAIKAREEAEAFLAELEKGIERARESLELCRSHGVGELEQKTEALSL